MGMEFTTMIIEVKYGDTLKRFDAPITEIGELNLDLTGLKEKISGLFSLPYNGEYILTHIIEFGSDKGGEELPMFNDDHLRTAALLHHTKSKAAQLKRLGKNCRNEGDSGAKEDEEVFKVECKRESVDQTSWLPQVIQVHFEDTVKSFDARVDEKGELDLDFAELRAKIRDLFSLPSEALLDLCCCFVKDCETYMIANDRDLSEAAWLKKMKFDFAVAGVHIKNLKERLYREFSFDEPVPEKDKEVFTLYCDVLPPTLKRKSKDEDQSSSLHQVKKVKWYEPPPSSNRFKEMEKRFLEVREECCKGIDELGDLNSETQHIIDEKEAETQFHVIMSKLNLQMIQILEIFKGAPKTPEEFIEKFELIESMAKGFRESALKAPRK